MNPGSTQWSPDTVEAVNCFDTWSSLLNSSHLRWSLKKPEQPSFTAEINMKRMGEFQLVRCSCDPCAGQRQMSDISHDHDDYFGLLLVHHGSEYIYHRNREHIVHPGDLFMWDSTQPLKFVLSDKLQKTTLFIPQSFLRKQLFQVDQLTGSVLPAQTGLGALICANLTAIGEQMHSFAQPSSAFTANMVMELITWWLQQLQPATMTSSQHDLLLQALDYIHQQLADPALCPQQVADHYNISLRHLYRLFAASNLSISKWITEQRLERCRRDLIKSRSSISDVAFHWGFSDASHFNRIFKRTYQVTPGQYQKRHKR